MGQFSWLDCIDRKQIRNNVAEKVYVLVPKEFGGGHITENCYDGYGNFGGYDINELVAIWNKEFMKQHPEFVTRCSHDQGIGHESWYNAMISESHNPSDWNTAPKGIRKNIERTAGCELGWIGIVISCYDEDNRRLAYPIKITHDPMAIYEDCQPSDGDPYQGLW